MIVILFFASIGLVWAVISLRQVSDRYERMVKRHDEQRERVRAALDRSRSEIEP